MTPAPYDGVKLDDIEEAVNYIKKKYKGAPLYVVGTSFGGN